MSDLKTILDSANVPQAVKANAWDVYQSSSSPQDFQTKFDALPLDKATKANLWDLKFSQQPAPKAEPDDGAIFHAVKSFGGDLWQAAKSLYHTGADTPTTTGDKAALALGGPLGVPLKRMVNGYYNAVQDSIEKAKKSAEAGDIAGVMFHSAAAGLPLVGPLTEGIYDKAKSGDTAGAVGTGMSRAVQAASMAPEGSVIPNPASLATKGTVAVVNKAADIPVKQIARVTGDALERNSPGITKTGAAGSAVAAGVGTVLKGEPMYAPGAAALAYNTTHIALSRGLKAISQSLQEFGGRISKPDALAEAENMRQPASGQMDAANAEAVPKGQKNAAQAEASAATTANTSVDRPKAAQFVSDDDIRDYITQPTAGLKIDPIKLTKPATAAIESLVDQIAPAAKGKSNLGLKMDVGFDLRNGNISKAAERIAANVNPKAWADVMDEAGISQEMRQDLENHLQSALRQERADFAAGNSMDTPKWQRVAEAQGEMAKQKVITDAAAKNVNPLRGLPNVTKTKSFTAQPLPEDLTALLEKSIAAALLKKGKK